MTDNCPARPRMKQTLFSEFMVVITLIVVPLAVGLSWYSIENVNRISRQQYLLELESLADEKASAINRYIDVHLNQVETLSLMPVVRQALPAITGGFLHGGVNSAPCLRASRQFGGFFSDYLSQWGYYDLFLIDASGDVVFTIQHESDLGTNLVTGPYRDSGLGQVFHDAVHQMQVSNSPFEYYPPSQEEGAFVAAPVIDHGKLLGVVALQFNTDAFYQVVNDFSGLGRSGEVVVGQVNGDHILITAPLRHDANAAFTRKIDLHADNARPIREGAQGQSGEGEIEDWRGEQVLAVWQYLPALQWGMVVKIDTSEVFGYWHSVQKSWLGVIAFGLLLAYLMIYFFARHRTEPLLRLTAASLDYAEGKGNVAIRDLASNNNETGVLAGVLHRMLGQIEQSRAEQQRLMDDLAEHNRLLDQRVAEQTEYIRAMVAHAADGIIVIDVSGIIQRVNPALLQMFGYTEEQLLGENVTLLMPESYRESHLNGIERHQWRDSESLVELSAEREGLRKSGEVFPVDVRITEMRVGGQRLFLGMLRDITRAKQQRDQLEHTQRLESLGVLAGGIAHDFNNLLTAILGNAALAKVRLDHGHPAMELMGNVEKASERAAALCKQMLAYSGKGKFVVERINLTMLIEEMVSLLTVSIDKSVVMRLDLSEQLPDIEADAAQMQQIVMNLVINASEAIDRKSGIITIHTGVVEVDETYIETTYLKDFIQPGRFVTMEVSDTGCGMDEQTKKRIFDPFFTTKFTGRGLGMSAILGIVRGHHGAIKVYSEPGKGTTFKVLFPCAALDADGARQAPSAGPDGGGDEGRVCGTILIVDDEETIRVTAAAILEHIGFTTLSAENGEEGVALFQHHHVEINAVLLDMTMPKMGGEEAFREMRCIDPEVRVVLSSGYNEQDATSHFAGKGLAGFIQKPYTPQMLQTKMVEIVSKV